MASIIRRYVRNQIADAAIKAYIQPSGAVLAVSPTHADIQVDDSVAGIGETADEYMLSLGYRLQATNPASPLVAFYGSSKLVNDVLAVTSDAAFETVGGVITNPGFFVDNLAATFGRITGAYQATGATGELQIIECRPDGSDPELKMPPVVIPDTAGAWTVLELGTSMPPRPNGPWEYALQARLNGSAALSLKYVSMSLMQLALP